MLSDGHQAADDMMMTEGSPAKQQSYDQLFSCAEIDCLPCEYDMGVCMDSVDAFSSGLDMLSPSSPSQEYETDDPSRTWLPTIYIPGPTGFDDLLSM